MSPLMLSGTSMSQDFRATGRSIVTTDFGPPVEAEPMSSPGEGYLAVAEFLGNAEDSAPISVRKPCIAAAFSRAYHAHIAAAAEYAVPAWDSRPPGLCCLQTFADPFPKLWHGPRRLSPE